MNKNISVSIKCITFNHERYIAEAIESFLMQKTNFNFEILIRDDASTDGTQEIIKKYKKKFPEKIKTILHKENQMSKGIKRASFKDTHPLIKGKYIAICEGDDYWTDPCKLQKQFDFMENHSECSLVTHAVQMVNARNNKKNGIISPYNKNQYCKVEDIIMGGGGFFGTNSLFYRKNIMDNPPKWYFDFPVGDYPLQMFLSFKGNVYYINEIMSVYRINVKNSWTSNYKKGKNFKDKMKTHILENINCFKEIQKNVSEEYSNIINSKINQLEFDYNVLNNNLKIIKSNNDYLNIWRNLSNYKKSKIIIKSYFPKLYEIIHIIKTSIDLKK